jgi:hypothetical protein
MKKSIIALAVAASFAAAAANAQSGPTTPFSIEPRAGLSLPVGDLADEVDAGLALTGDLIFQATPQLALYAGYNFNTYAFKDVEDVDAQIKGFDAGVRFSFAPMSGFTPFLKGGAVYQKAAITDGGSSLNGDYRFGFQVGGGVDVPITPRFSFTPQAAFAKVDEAQYVNVEAGLRIRL